jgi:hypothetical protein
VLSRRAADTEACCHVAPPTQRRVVTSRRRHRGVLSRRAADTETNEIQREF